MDLKEKNINDFYKTLIEIIENKYNVKIEYQVIKKELDINQALLK